MHAAVGQVPLSLRAMVAMLCLALTVLFAGSSAATVVDHAQHGAAVSHEHGVHLTSTVSAHDLQADSDHDHASGVDSQDQQGGVGHCHVDPPSGGLNTSPAYCHVLDGAPVVRPLVTSAKVEDTRPGGLERPPRRLASFV
jgi:hypothetical protein